MSNIKTLDEIRPECDNRVFIGVDPGKSGGCGVIIIKDGIETHVCWKFPKEVTNLNVQLLSSIPTSIPYKDVHIMVEHVHAFPKQGTVSMFSFGQNLGQWEATLHANELDFEYINPKNWIYWYDIKPGIDKKERKRILLGKAKELFPNIKVTFNVSDALLIANYCAEMYYEKTYGG